MTEIPGGAIHEPEDQRVAELLLEIGAKRLSRREVLRRGVALGLSVPAIGWLLAACGGGSSATKTPASSGVTSPTATKAAAATSPSGGSTGASPTTSGGASNSPTTGSPEATVGSTTGNGTPTNGGRLTLVITSNVPDLDPHSAYDSTASAVFFGTHEMLVRLKGSDTYSYQPMLATEWSNSPDFVTWTFKIAPNAKFHDGTPCDGPAVVRSFQRFHQLGLGPVNVITRFVDKPEDITSPDPQTVQFKLKTGNELFIAAMASQYGPLVVSPAAMDAHKTEDDPYAHEWFRANPVGTGPYKLKEYVQNDHITLEKFDDFHSGWDGAHFDEIVFRIVAENATRRSLVESGQADATTQNLTPKDVTEIDQEGKLAVLKYDSTAVFWTEMNGATITDPKARQGFSYAFPYDDVRTGVYEGLIIETSGPCTPNTRGYDKNGFIYKTDMDKAKQLLTDANWDMSKKLEYWVTDDDENGKGVAQLFQANLQSLGIQMDIVSKEGGAFNDFFYGDAPGDQRPEFWSWSWWPDYNDGYNEIYPNFYSQSGQTSNGANSDFYNDKDLDALLDKVAPGVTQDVYNTSLAQANDILTQQNPAALYWGTVKWYTVMQKNIGGFQPNPIYINTYNLYDMYRTQ